MEFIKPSEVTDLLDNYGFQEETEGDGDRVYLVMPDSGGVVHLHLKTADSAAEPRSGAKVIEVAPEDLVGFVDTVIHRLNISDLVLIPVGRWRAVFDAVAFSMAANEDWQEFDAAATVELNTRDPLLCGPADFTLVIELIRALMNDADSPDQGFMLTATAVPLLVEIVPTGAVRVGIGNQVLADEILEVVEA